MPKKSRRLLITALRVITHTQSRASGGRRKQWIREVQADLYWLVCECGGRAGGGRAGGWPGLQGGWTGAQRGS